MTEFRFSKFNTRVGEPVWIPYHRKWIAAVVNYIGPKNAYVIFCDRGGVGTYPYRRLRKRHPELQGRDIPTQPTQEVTA